MSHRDLLTLVISLLQKKVNNNRCGIPLSLKEVRKGLSPRSLIYHRARFTINFYILLLIYESSN